jgi:hypothetical protein
VTPSQLYERLLSDADVPRPLREGARRFRHGRAEMQIHFALSEPALWDGDERLSRTAIVHVTPGLDGVSRAVNEAERGLLPAEATIVAGQPLTIDASRAPAGKGLLWIQLQELPWHVKGDAAGELETGDGTWSDDLRERYADRIQARLAQHIPNLEASIVERVVLSPADDDARLACHARRAAGLADEKHGERTADPHRPRDRMRCGRAIAERGEDRTRDGAQGRDRSGDDEEEDDGSNGFAHRCASERSLSAARCVSGGFKSSVATSVPEPAPRPGPGQVLAPMCQSRSTAVACPGLRGNGRQRKFWSSESAPPYGSP